MKGVLHIPKSGSRVLLAVSLKLADFRLLFSIRNSDGLLLL